MSWRENQEGTDSDLWMEKKLTTPYRVGHVQCSCTKHREREREREIKDRRTLNITKSPKSFKEGSAQHETTKYGYSGGGIEGVALNSQPPWHWGRLEYQFKEVRTGIVKRLREETNLLWLLNVVHLWGLWCVWKGEGDVGSVQSAFMNQTVKKNNLCFCVFRPFVVGVVYS